MITNLFVRVSVPLSSAGPWRLFRVPGGSCWRSRCYLLSPVSRVRPKLPPHDQLFVLPRLRLSGCFVTCHIVTTPSTWRQHNIYHESSLQDEQNIQVNDILLEIFLVMSEHLLAMTKSSRPLQKFLFVFFVRYIKVGGMVMVSWSMLIVSSHISFTQSWDVSRKSKSHLKITRHKINCFSNCFCLFIFNRDF